MQKHIAYTFGVTPHNCKKWCFWTKTNKKNNDLSIQNVYNTSFVDPLKLWDSLGYMYNWKTWFLDLYHDWVAVTNFNCFWKCLAQKFTLFKENLGPAFLAMKVYDWIYLLWKIFLKIITIYWRYGHVQWGTPCIL